MSENEKQPEPESNGDFCSVLRLKPVKEVDGIDMNAVCAYGHSANGAEVVASTVFECGERDQATEQERDKDRE